MNYLVCLPLCSILLTLEPQHAGLIRSAENELSARQGEARFFAESGNAFPAVTAPPSFAPVLSVAQATGTPGKRTANVLRDVALSEWTREEAESNQKLFWERYQFEIQAAMVGIQIRIKSCEQEITNNKHLKVLDSDKLKKCDDYLKKIQALIRANRFPADLDGEIMSKDELLGIRTAYETLRKQILEHMQPQEELIRAANTQVILFRSEMQQKMTDLKTAETFVRRLDSHEKTPDFREVLNSLHAGKSLTEIGEEAFPEQIEDNEKKEVRKAPIRNVSGILDRKESK